MLYAEGCRITESTPDWNADKTVPADPQLDKKRIAEAVATMQKADVGIVVVGENEADGQTRLSILRQVTALSVRIRAELYDFPPFQSEGFAFRDTDIGNGQRAG